MSLVGPWLNNIGNSKKRKQKYASAEAKRLDLQLKQEWEQKLSNINKTKKNLGPRPLTSPFVKLGPPPGRETKFIASLDTGVGIAAKKENKVYTGTKIIGIGTMHKSNAVPIFSDDEAKAIATMRR